MKKIQQIISGLIIGSLLVSNSIAGLSFDAHANPNASPYELKRIVYDGGFEGTSIEDEDQDEGLLDLTDLQDARFIDGYLYLLLIDEDRYTMHLEKYDGSYNKISSTEIPSGNAYTDYATLLFDESNQTLVISASHPNEDEYAFYSYDLEGNLISSTHTPNQASSNILYSHADSAVVMTYFEDIAGITTMKVTSTDGTLLHEIPFTGIDMDQERTYVESIVGNFYFVYSYEYDYNTRYKVDVQNQTVEEIILNDNESFSISTPFNSSYPVQVIENGEWSTVTIFDENLTEIAEFQTLGESVSTYDTFYNPNTWIITAMKWDFNRDAWGIATYNAATGEKIYQSDMNGALIGLNETTGIVYSVHMSYDLNWPNNTLHAFDPSTNTLTLIGKSYESHWFGYGYGHGPSNLNININDNFNSITLDENKDLIIGAWDSIRVLAQNGETVESYGGSRIENNWGNTYIYPSGQWYTATDKYKNGFSGLDSMTWDVGEESTYTHGSSIDSFRTYNDTDTRDSESEFDPQAKSLINRNGVVINNVGNAWKIFQNDGTYLGTAYVGDKYRNKISDNYIIHSTDTGFKIYDFNGNFIKDIAGWNGIWDNYTTWGDTIYYFHDNGTDIILSSVDIENGNAIEELSFPKATSVEYHVGHVEAPGTLYLGKNDRNWGNPLSTWYTYDLENKTLATVRERSGEGAHDFLVLSNGNIASQIWNQMYVTTGSGVYVGDSIYRFSNLDISLFPANNGFFVFETATASQYSAPYALKRTISLYDNDGKFVKTIYTGKYISGSSNGSVDENRNILFTDDRYLYSIDPEGNLTQKHLLGNGWWGIMRNALGVAIDNANNEVFISDTQNGRIQVKPGNSQNVYRTIGFWELQKPSGIDISPITGDIYVVDAGMGARNVRIYGKDGTNKGIFVDGLPLFTRDIGCSYDFARFYYGNEPQGPGMGSTDFIDLNNEECVPVGIAVDNSGKVYISHDKWIRVYNADGTLYTEINETTHPETFLDKSFLRGIDVDGNGDIYVVDSSIEFTVTQREEMLGYNENTSGKWIIAKKQTNDGGGNFISQVMNFIIPSTHAQSEGCYDYGYGYGYWNDGMYTWCDSEDYGYGNEDCNDYGYGYGNCEDEEKINRILIFSLADEDDTGNEGNNGGNDGSENPSTPGNPSVPSNPSTPTPPTSWPGGGGSGGNGGSNGGNNKWGSSTIPNNPLHEKPNSKTDNKTVEKAPEDVILPSAPDISSHVTPTGNTTSDGKEIYRVKNPLTDRVCTELVKVHESDELLLEDMKNQENREFKGYTDILAMFRALEKDEETKWTTFELYKNDGVVLNAEYFEGERGITRAEFTKILVRSLACHYTNEGNDTVFSDVDSTLWYAPYIQFAYKNWWLNGYSDGTFRPNASISREEAAKILARAVSLTDGSSDNMHTSFEDVDPHSEFLPYIEALRAAGILSGKTSKQFDPTGNISRNESSKIVGKVFFGTGD